MSINPRAYGNLALLLGTGSLIAAGWLPLQFTDQCISGGTILVAAGLMLRVLAPDSRVKQSRAGVLDALVSGVIGAAVVSVWWNQPVPADAPQHHNDGGDVVAILFLPFAWAIVTGLLLLFCIGMATTPRPVANAEIAPD